MKIAQYLTMVIGIAMIFPFQTLGMELSKDGSTVILQKDEYQFYQDHMHQFRKLTDALRKNGKDIPVGMRNILDDMEKRGFRNPTLLDNAKSYPVKLNRAKFVSILQELSYFESVVLEIRRQGPDRMKAWGNEIRDLQEFLGKQELPGAEEDPGQEDTIGAICQEIQPVLFGIDMPSKKSYCCILRSQISNQVMKCRSYRVWWRFQAESACSFEALLAAWNATLKSKKCSKHSACQVLP